MINNNIVKSHKSSIHIVGNHNNIIRRIIVITSIIRSHRPTLCRRQLLYFRLYIKQFFYLKFTVITSIIKINVDYYNGY